MTLARRTRGNERARRSVIVLSFALVSAGGCAVVSGLNGLALDPRCGDSCASEDGGVTPMNGNGDSSAGPEDGSPADHTPENPEAGSETGTARSDSGTEGGEEGGLPAGEIRCSAAGPCTAGGEECCMSSATVPALSCSSTSDPQRCPGGTELKCDDRSDCPGNVCCIQLNASGYVLQTLCQSSCSATGWFELCGAGGTCDAGTCSALTVLPNPPLTPPWFYACQ
jgi:hypothetical protein